mmetsp:Transcript_112716/g.251563  ORF Transcript_112716/g.251563 Transcript_112716/m.251563 type:complete len:83 (-) Transcript_112716:36-284(-)
MYICRIKAEQWCERVFCSWEGGAPLRSGFCCTFARECDAMAQCMPLTRVRPRTQMTCSIAMHGYPACWMLHLEMGIISVSLR